MGPIDSDKLPLVPAKQLLQRTKGDFWFGMDYTMNIYRGCSHGCIYCDSRSECYQIDDFDTVAAKANALDILADNLARKRLKGVIGTGAMSDPYNPREAQYLLTRQALALIAQHGFGVGIATKSDLIVRDIDLLKRIQAHAPVICKITITTLDANLAKQIEPYAPSPQARLQAVKALSEAGLFTGVLAMPILPWLTDSPQGIVDLVNQVADAGANFIFPGFGVTLRDKQRAYFYKSIERYYPGLSQSYHKAFGNQYSCSARNAKALSQLFRETCEQRGLLFRMKDIIAAYKVSPEPEQIRFF